MGPIFRVQAVLAAEDSREMSHACLVVNIARLFPSVHIFLMNVTCTYVLCLSLFSLHIRGRQCPWSLNIHHFLEAVFVLFLTWLLMACLWSYCIAQLYLCLYFFLKFNSLVLYAFNPLIFVSITFFSSFLLFMSRPFSLPSFSPIFFTLVIFAVTWSFILEPRWPQSYDGHPEVLSCCPPLPSEYWIVGPNILHEFWVSFMWSEVEI